MRPRTLAIISLTLCAARTVSAGPEPAVVVCPDAIQPQVALDSDGGVYITFIHKGDICVAVSKDKGKSFSPPVVAISVEGKAEGGLQRGPRIGIDAKKNIVVTAPVVFDQAEYKNKYPTAEIYLVSSADGGKSWTKPLQVNEVSKKAPESLHWLAVAPSGEAHVAWLDIRNRKEVQDLYYARVSDGKVGANVKVGSEVCECCAPGLAVSKSGLPVVAWREGGKKSSSRDLWLLTSRVRGQFAPAQKLNGGATNVFG